MTLLNDVVLTTESV